MKIKHLQLVLATQLMYIVTSQNGRSYDTNDWVPVTQKDGGTLTNDERSEQKKPTGRVLNLDAPSQKFFPDEIVYKKGRPSIHSRPKTKDRHNVPKYESTYKFEVPPSLPHTGDQKLHYFSKQQVALPNFEQPSHIQQYNQNAQTIVEDRLPVADAPITYDKYTFPINASNYYQTVNPESINQELISNPGFENFNRPTGVQDNQGYLQNTNGVFLNNQNLNSGVQDNQGFFQNTNEAFGNNQNLNTGVQGNQGLFQKTNGAFGNNQNLDTGVQDNQGIYQKTNGAFGNNKNLNTGASQNNQVVQDGKTSQGQIEIEKEAVQLVYVPLENLKDTQLVPQDSQMVYKQIQPPTYEKQHRLAGIEQDFIQQALQATKLQEQIHHGDPLLYETPTTAQPIVKRKPHQPPLAVYVEAEKQIDVTDVLDALKGVKSITVQDTVRPHSPQIFIGPSTLETSDYTKFPLPYLNSVDGKTIKGNIENLPFFVAPLSFKTPPGFSKIPLPAPHVGSVLVSTKEDKQSTIKPLPVTTPKSTFASLTPQPYTAQTYYSTPLLLPPQPQLLQFNINGHNKAEYKYNPLTSAQSERANNQITLKNPSTSPPFQYAYIDEISEITSPKSTSNKYNQPSTVKEEFNKPITYQQAFDPQQYTISSKNIQALVDYNRNEATKEEEQVVNSTPKEISTSDQTRQTHLPEVNPLELAINEFELHEINTQLEEKPRVKNQNSYKAQSNRFENEEYHFDPELHRFASTPSSILRDSYAETTMKPPTRQRGRIRSRPTTTTTTSTTTAPYRDETYTVLEDFFAAKTTPRPSNTQYEQIPTHKKSVSFKYSQPGEDFYAVKATLRPSSTPRDESQSGDDFYVAKSSPRPSNTQYDKKLVGSEEDSYDTVPTNKPSDSRHVTHETTPTRDKYSGPGEDFYAANPTPKPSSTHYVDKELVDFKYSEPVDDFFAPKSTHRPSNTRYVDTSTRDNFAGFKYSDFGDDFYATKATTRPSNTQHETTHGPKQSKLTGSDSVSEIENIPSNVYSLDVATKSRNEAASKDHAHRFNQNPDFKPYEVQGQFEVNHAFDNSEEKRSEYETPLGDPSVRSLLIPNLLVPTTSNNVYTGPTYLPTTEKLVSTTDTTTTTSTTTTTERPIESSTQTRVRGRTRGGSRYNEYNTTKRSSRRRPTQSSRATTERTRYNPDVEYSTKSANTKQRSRIRGRTTPHSVPERLPTTENEIPEGPSSETNLNIRTHPDGSESYIQYEQTVHEKDVEPVINRIEEPSQQPILQYENTAGTQKPVINVQVTYPVHNYRPLEEEGIEHQKVQVRGRFREKQRSDTTSTEKITTRRTTTTESPTKKEESSEEFYGFFKQPNFGPPQETQVELTTTPAASRILHYQTVSQHGEDYQVPIDTSTVRFVGEIVPKYTTSREIQITETPKPRIRGRTRNSPRKTHQEQSDQTTRRNAVVRSRGRTHYKIPDKVKQQKDEEADVEGGNYPLQYFQGNKGIITTPKSVFQITVGPEVEDQDDQAPHSSIYRPNVVATPDEWHDASLVDHLNEDKSNGNVIDNKQEDPLKIIDTQSIPDDQPYALPVQSLPVTTRTETITESSEEKFRQTTQQIEDQFQAINNFKHNETAGVEKKKRRKGAWKLVKQRPVDNLETSESQNYLSVINSFHDIRKVSPMVQKSIVDEEKPESFTDTTESTNYDDELIKTTNEITERTVEIVTEPVTSTSTASSDQTGKEEDFLDSIYEMFGMNRDNQLQEEPSTSTTQQDNDSPATTMFNPTFPEEITEPPVTTNVTDSPMETTTLTDDILTTLQTDKSKPDTKAHFEVEPWDMKQVRTSTSTEVSHETEICYRGRCVRSTNKKKNI